MPHVSLHQRPARGALLSRLVWPTAILFAVTLAAVFGSLLWTSGSADQSRLVPIVIFGSAVALALLALLACSVRWLASDLARSQERAQSLIGRDPLSSLPNRLLFTERLDNEIGRLGRAEGGIAVHFLDLDRFKDVNDTYGHHAGDDLIKQVAQRLSDLLRGADTLARFGGDEFAIIQTGIRSSQDAEALARRILDSISRPFAIAGAEVSVGVSIGVALAPQNGTTNEVLMRLADTALYQAKSEGRNRFSFFERTMDEAIRMRKVVEDDLRHAILRDELILHYQPLYSADGSTIVAVEALVRWPHAKQGMISPVRFISIAEESGLVMPLGEWVLRRACQDGKRWPNLRIAVNVSPIQFRHRDFVDGVVRTLRETSFDPSRLELELTEGVVVEDADAAEAAMMELRALGVNLALDDFGTGYSSLIYLRRFAFDKIKIDRSFLESMEATGESAILVHSIVHLGRALGLTVTAEGVETVEQHRFLQALGCHQLQGFLFSKPVPPDEIDRLLGLKPVEIAKVA
jgi:diguanylate cyclase (GGDEF)-like protein